MPMCFNLYISKERKMATEELETKVKDEVLAVFRFRNQLTRCPS